MKPLLLAATVAACVAMPGDFEPARSLAAAENAFAAHSMREDMRAAFLANFAPDGMMVRRGWVVAREWLAPRQAPPIVLDWHPVYVEASAAGDLGLSTGPWKSVPRNGPREVSHGQFVSIWRRGPDGVWRVEVDIGIGHGGEPALWSAPLFVRRTPATRSEAPLAAAEDEFARISSREGMRAAYARLGAADMRLYRPDAPPFLGLDAALQGAGDERLLSTAEHVATATSRDLGYARGHHAAMGRPEAMQGYFMRVWRHQPEGWRIILDVANPAN